MLFRGHGASDVGRRKNNEDALLVAPEHGLWVVADGMGGYDGGEVAARTAVDSLARYFGKLGPEGLGTHLDEDDYALAKSRVDLSLRIAHREILRRKTGRLAQMGCTIALLATQGSRAVIAHVGDSRVYLLRNRRLCALTRDHSLYAEFESTGTKILPPRSSCGFTHVVTRALGAPGDSRPDVSTEEVRPGDVFLLCSDGLTDVIPDLRLEALLNQSPAEELPERLCAEAYGAGGSDNITVLLVEALAG